MQLKWLTWFLVQREGTINSNQQSNVLPLQVRKVNLRRESDLPKITQTKPQRWHSISINKECEGFIFFNRLSLIETLLVLQECWQKLMPRRNMANTLPSPFLFICSLIQSFDEFLHILNSHSCLSRDNHLWALGTCSYVEEVGKCGKYASGINRRRVWELRGEVPNAGLRGQEVWSTGDSMWLDFREPFVCIKLNKPGLCLSTQDEDCNINSGREYNWKAQCMYRW